MGVDDATLTVLKPFRGVDDGSGFLALHTVVDSFASALVTAIQERNSLLNNQVSYVDRSDSFTATGNGTTIDTITGVSAFGFQVDGGGFATWDARLEGSLDSTNFTQVIQHTNTDGDDVLKWQTDRPARYVRSRLAGVTGAGTLVARFFGMP